MSVPPGWDMASLHEVTLRPQKVNPVVAGRKSIRYIDIGSVDGGGHRLNEVGIIPASEAPSRARQLVRSGDTLFSTVRPYLEKIALVPKSLDGEFASTGFSVLRPGPRLLPGFLYYYAISQAMLGQVLPLQKGVSYPAVLDREVRAVRIPVPPLVEQRRIVEFLDVHLSKLNSGMNHLSAAEAGLDVLESAYVGAEIGMAQTLRLEDLIAEPLRSGRSVRTAENGFPVLRLTAMHNGIVNLSERKSGLWSRADAEPFLVNAGDVFVSRGNGSLRLVGRASYVDEEPYPIAFPDTMIRVRPNRALIRPDFLVFLWNSRVVRRQIERLARTTAGIYKVNQGDLRSIQLPVPSLQQQACLVERMAELNARLEAGQRSLRMASVRAVSLRRSLLTAALSGRLTRGVGVDRALEDIEREQEAWST